MKLDECWAVPVDSSGDFAEFVKISDKMEAWKDKYTMNSVGIGQYVVNMLWFCCIQQMRCRR